MSTSSAPPSPFRARRTSCRSSSSRWAFCAAVAGRAAIDTPGSRVKSHPKVEAKIAGSAWIYKVLAMDPGCYEHTFALGLAATHPLQRLSRPRIEPIAQLARPFLAVLHRFHVAEECSRRQLLHLLSGRAANGRVRGDQDDVLAPPVLGGEALEQR